MVLSSGIFAYNNPSIKCELASLMFVHRHLLDDGNLACPSVAPYFMIFNTCVNKLRNMKGRFTLDVTLEICTCRI